MIRALDSQTNSIDHTRSTFDRNYEWNSYKSLKVGIFT